MARLETLFSSSPLAPLEVHVFIIFSGSLALCVFIALRGSALGWCVHLRSWLALVN
jgi:hypothetical protein